MSDDAVQAFLSILKALETVIVPIERTVSKTIPILLCQMESSPELFQLSILDSTDLQIWLFRYLA